MPVNVFSYGQKDVANVKAGDVIRLNGERVRVLKKTNFNMSVEPYTWFDAIEDWILEKLGKLLP